MGLYELVVVGCAERTLRVALEDLVEERPHAGAGGSLAVRVTDQAGRSPPSSGSTTSAS